MVNDIHGRSDTHLATLTHHIQGHADLHGESCQPWMYLRARTLTSPKICVSAGRTSSLLWPHRPLRTDGLTLLRVARLASASWGDRGLEEADPQGPCEKWTSNVPSFVPCPPQCSRTCSRVMGGSVCGWVGRASGKEVRLVTSFPTSTPAPLAFIPASWWGCCPSPPHLTPASLQGATFWGAEEQGSGHCPETPHPKADRLV